MISKFMILFLMFYSPSILASEFVETKSTSSENKALINLMSSSVVKLIFKNGPNCSGTWISNENHLLTSLHCLTSCIEKLQFSGKTPLTIKEINLNEQTTIFPKEFKKSELSHIKCELATSEHRSESSGLVAKIEYIKASGFIYLEERDLIKESRPDILKDLIKQGHTGMGDIDDFVILKIEQVEKEIKVPNDFSWPSRCAKFDDSDIAVNENLYSLSYPKLERKSMNSVYRQMFTQGQRVQNQDNFIFSDESYKLDYPIDVPFIVTTLDDAEGASGSSIFDSHGKIRALTSLRYSSEDTTYESGTSISIPMSYILKDIEPTLKAKLCH